MHTSSYKKMEAFRRQYLTGREGEPLTILDLGSQDVCGSYRPIFDVPKWKYIGIDMAAGKNVDVVLRAPYAWREIATGLAEVVISGQTFEHIQYFWITMLEIARVLKPGGLCCILAPSSGPEHRYPTDCWRFYPDGMRSLASFADLEALEVSTQWGDEPQEDDSNQWHDSLLVCRKPDLGILANFRSAFKRRIRYWGLTMGMR